MMSLMQQGKSHSSKNPDTQLTYEFYIDEENHLHPPHKEAQRGEDLLPSTLHRIYRSII